MFTFLKAATSTCNQMRYLSVFREIDKIHQFWFYPLGGPIVTTEKWALKF